MGPVDLVVPIKRLDRAKSRLRGAVPGVVHAELVLALLLDTVTAAVDAPGVRRLLVICEDDRVPVALRGTGAECVDVRGLPGLNAALEHGAGLLRAADPRGAVGALQADLPALRSADLGAALTAAAGQRAFCADRPGTGTTLLVTAPGQPLAPRFGVGSAAAHAAGGAVRLEGADSLRCDVDTGADLSRASELGLGGHSATLLAESEKFTTPFDRGCTIRP